MVKTTFEIGIDRISALTKKVYSNSHIDFMYDELKYISDVNFRKILREYIRELPIPANIVGYFCGKNAILCIKYSEIDKSVGVSGGEYSKKALNLFSKCTAILMSRRFPKDMNKSSVLALNKQWMGHSGDDLDRAMEYSHKELLNIIGG